jgi:hypothetical protein
MVDIVMDNAGFELFVDMCLAGKMIHTFHQNKLILKKVESLDFLLQSHLATKIRLRVKVNPWFVSDTTIKDIEWMLEKLKDGAVNPVAGDGKNDSLQSQENDADLEKLGKIGSFLFRLPEQFSIQFSKNQKLFSGTME